MIGPGGSPASLRLAPRAGREAFHRAACAQGLRGARARGADRAGRQPPSNCPLQRRPRSFRGGEGLANASVRRWAGWACCRWRAAWSRCRFWSQAGRGRRAAGSGRAGGHLGNAACGPRPRRRCRRQDWTEPAEPAPGLSAEPVPRLAVVRAHTTARGALPRARSHTDVMLDRCLWRH